MILDLATLGRPEELELIDQLKEIVDVMTIGPRPGEDDRGSADAHEIPWMRYISSVLPVAKMTRSDEHLVLFAVTGDDMEPRIAKRDLPVGLLIMARANSDALLEGRAAVVFPSEMVGLEAHDLVDHRLAISLSWST
jgi:hypothetical protein